MIFLRIILIPVSVLYAGIIYLRNKLYDSDILKTVKVTKPVISIGNISTGGTGKTPFTIFTAEYFLEKGFSVGIISRGYKRKSEGLVIVCDGKNIIGSSEQSGDELAMTANALSEYKNKLFIAACIDRSGAAKYIIENFNPDIIILDDGFQHRKLSRDLDIVIADAGSIIKNKFLNHFTLPSGILRENFGSLNRADIIIQNNKDKTFEVLSVLKKYGKEIISMRYKTEYLKDFKNIILNTDTFSNKAIIFSGLADDSSFLQMVKDLNINVSENINYNDHHDYTETDIDHLKSRFRKNTIFITTEKDFVKIKNFKNFMEEFPVYYLKINIEIEKNTQLLFNNYDKLLK
ncbi:MAG TPA: tetraacyldisaccharide 4'-kinase [Ignavibacteria bacterium]|nr:tetraacyldisaccharide 4'-kinase [Ignavibacteria bacterium]